MKQISKEVENVLKLDMKKKYQYFLKKIADYGELWSLKDDDGWVTLGQEEDDCFFPVWPKQEFAELCISEDWQDCKCEAIDIDEFLEDWIPGLKEDGIRVTIMWNEGAGIDVDWDGLARDIEHELEQYD